MNVIDIFCGCGGLSYGFAKEGFNIVAAFDNWKPAIDTYNENFLHEAINKDAYSITKDDLIRFAPDIIIGGPPCQDYSSAGKRDESCGRADLTKRYAEIIIETQPKWFVMENVDRILKSKTLPIAIELYKKTGYGLTKVVLDASLCGVPQKRKRFFLIGELNGKDGFLEKALIDDQTTTSMTIFDYLGNEFNTEYYYRHPRSYMRRGIFSIHEPSPTVRGVNRPIPPNYPGHRGDATKNLSEVRPLTTKERARIQTFPKTFRLIGNKTETEQIIGNAVPVELAAYVAKHLKAYINNKYNFDEKRIEEQIRFEPTLNHKNLFCFSNI